MEENSLSTVKKNAPDKYLIHQRTPDVLINDRFFQRNVLNTDQTLFSSILISFSLYQAPVARICQPLLHFYRGCVINMTNFQRSVTSNTCSSKHVFNTSRAEKWLGGEERRGKKWKDNEKREEAKERRKGNRKEEARKGKETR